MSRWWIASWLALTCVACSSSGDATIDVVFDPCGPIALAAPAAATAVQAAGVRDAAALWAARGLAGMGATGGGEIAIVFEPAAEAFHGVYDDEHGIIYINSKITEPRALAIVIAHELGHAMGLPHETGEVSLMNTGNTTVEPTAGDAARLRALWGACATSSSAPPGS